MSRALRRQQLIQKPPAKGPAFRPSGARPQRKQQQQAAAAAEAARKKTFFERIPLIGRPLQDIVSELKKVTWPTREETIRLSVAVVAVTAAIGMLLGGTDVGFNWFVDNTLLR
jgi:preprotein translocase subunit SecE